MDSVDRFYVTVVSDGLTRRVGRLAGPFGSFLEADRWVRAARLAARDVDPRAAWYAFGVSKFRAPVGGHRPGVLNGRLGIG